MTRLSRFFCGFLVSAVVLGAVGAAIAFAAGRSWPEVIVPIVAVSLAVSPLLWGVEQQIRAAIAQPTSYGGAAGERMIAPQTGEPQLTSLA